MTSGRLLTQDQLGLGAHAAGRDDLGRTEQVVPAADSTAAYRLLLVLQLLAGGRLTKYLVSPYSGPASAVERLDSLSMWRQGKWLTWLS